jgi:hypothetical protein
MENKMLSIMTIFLLLATVATGQGKKTIKDKGITTITVEEYFIEEGMDEPVIESIEKFDEEGDLIELQVFNKRGDVKTWEKYVYNDNGDMVEQVFLDVKGRIVETEKTIYNGKLKTEKQYFNNKGNLYKRKVYKYEYRP